MTKEEMIQELYEKLNEIATRTSGDWETDHMDADDLLLEFINDERVKVAFNSIGKWYS